MNNKKISIIGGGAIPVSAGMGLVSLTYPLVKLEVTPIDITIFIRLKFLRKLLSIPSDDNNASWKLRWDQIDLVLRASNSVYISPCIGRGIRFVTFNDRGLDALTSLLEKNNVRVERVKTTVGKSFAL